MPMTVTPETNEVDYTVDPDKIPSLEPMDRYHASKLASYKVTIDFVEARRPSFDVVTLHPVLVFGRNLVQESATDLGRTNGTLFQTLLSEQPLMSQHQGVRILDVADAHVKVLDERITGFESYLLSGERCTWADIEQLVRKEIPESPLGWNNVQKKAKAPAVVTGKAQRKLRGRCL